MPSLFEMPKKTRVEGASNNIISRTTKTSAPPILVKSGSTSSTSKKGDILSQINLIKTTVTKNLGMFVDKYIVIREEDELTEYIDACINNDVISIDTETSGLNPLQDNLAGICIFTPNKPAAYVPLNHISYITMQKVKNQLSCEFVKEQFQRLVDKNTKVIMHNAQFDIRFLKNQLGVYFTCYWDTQIASFLMNENESHKLKVLYQKYCLDGEGDAFSFDDLFSNFNFQYIPITTAYLYAAHDAEITYELYKFQEPYLTIGCEECAEYELEDVSKIFREIEIPFIDTLVELEDTGITFDFKKNEELREKYDTILSEKVDNFYKICDTYSKEINTYRRIKGAECKLEDPIAIGSSQQLSILLYDILHLSPKNKEDGRSTGESVLQGIDHPICKAILEYREVAKLLNTFIDKLPQTISKDGKVHAHFNSMGAATGRLSCISEGTNIQLLNEEKHIEDVKAGDYIYCYDDFGGLHLSKVKNVWKTGYKRCVDIKWQSSGNGKIGHLICTPEHPIRLKDGSWCKAEDLKRYQKLVHLHRNMSGARPRFFGWSNLDIKEQDIIKRDVFKASNDMHIHHIDGNSMNNSISNLKLLTHSEHSSLHMKDRIKNGEKLGFMNPTVRENMNYSHKYGADNPKFIHTSKEELEQMIEDAKGVITKIPMDFDTFKHKCESYGVNIKQVASKYNKLYIDVTLEDFMDAYEKFHGVGYKIREYLNIGRDKYYRYLREYDISRNHMVQSVTDAGWYNVYDIEVEGYHNYIANEVCVHNSSEPNLQQIPSRGDGKVCRQMFVASPGYVLCGSDYSAQEPRICAHMCQDPKMIKAYKEGKDLYCEIASIAYDVSYEECLEHNPDGSTNAEGKKRRSSAKAIVLGVMYGKGIAAIADDLNTSKQKASQIYNKIMQEFPGLHNFIEESKLMAYAKGYVTTVWGRKRRLPNIQLPKYEFKNIGGIHKNFDPLDMDSNDENDVDEELVEYYVNQMDKAWGSKKQEIREEARKDGLDIKDNGGFIAEAERQCVNARIQGSAADMCKKAMNLIHYDKQLRDWGFRLLLPIHDELIGEAPIEYAKECGIRLANLMVEAADDFDVPFKTDAVWSKAWYGKEYDVNNVDELLTSLKENL